MNDALVLDNNWSIILFYPYHCNLLRFFGFWGNPPLVLPLTDKTLYEILEFPIRNRWKHEFLVLEMDFCTVILLCSFTLENSLNPNHFANFPFYFSTINFPLTCSVVNTKKINFHFTNYQLSPLFKTCIKVTPLTIYGF